MPDSVCHMLKTGSEWTSGEETPDRIHGSLMQCNSYSSHAGRWSVAARNQRRRPRESWHLSIGKVRLSDALDRDGQMGLVCSSLLCAHDRRWAGPITSARSTAPTAQRQIVPKVYGESGASCAGVLHAGPALHALQQDRSVAPDAGKRGIWQRMHPMSGGAHLGQLGLLLARLRRPFPGRKGPGVVENRTGAKMGKTGAWPDTALVGPGAKHIAPRRKGRAGAATVLGLSRPVTSRQSTAPVAYVRTEIPTQKLIGNLC